MEKTIKIAVSGAKGRIGQTIVDAVKTNPRFQLIKELSREDLANLKAENNQNNNANIDIIIDFSMPGALPALLSLCRKQKSGLVIGTTGFNENEKQQIETAAKEIPILLAPNMSIGINIIYKVLEFVTQSLMGQPVDIAILETHHKNKKDSPSGTSLRMGEVITNAQKTRNTQNTQTKNTLEPNIHFSSLRLSDSLGEHTAVFALEGERMEIHHKAMNKALYAKGALKAAEWLMNKPAGLYNMQDVLFQK